MFMDADTTGLVIDAMCMTGGESPDLGVVINEAAEISQEGWDVAATTYGDQAQKLKLSGFCDRPEVHNALGGDAAFLDFIRGREICVALPLEDDITCRGGIVPAHVRRIAKGAGTGIKPEYSAVPMCDYHNQRQHQRGESHVGGKDYLDRQAAKYLEKWGWWALKKELGYASMRDVPPKELRDWAFNHGLVLHLPACYQDA